MKEESKTSLIFSSERDCTRYGFFPLQIGPLSLPQNIPNRHSDIPNFNFGHQGASFPTVMPSTVSGQLSQSWNTPSAISNQVGTTNLFHNLDRCS